MDATGARRFLLSLLAHIPVSTRRAGDPARLLLLRPDHLGDLLFMTPALHALRSARPGAHITCLVGPWGETILRDNPDVDELLTCDYPWFNRRPKTSFWDPYVVLRREAQRLRAAGFDEAYIMRFDFWWGAALARLAGIPRRTGYALPSVQPFLTDAIPYTPGLHEVEQNLRLVGGSGGGDGGDVRRLRFTVPAAAAEWAATRLAPSASLPRAPLHIAIHPGAGAPVKLWTVNGWVSVANTLAQRHGATIVLTGGPAEVNLVQSIAAGLVTPHIVLAGETDLGQLAAVFARCRLALGADSGPLHLAVAVGTPTVHLLGPVDPALFGPWGDPVQHIVVQARFFDQPCHNHPCNRLDYSAAELAQHPCMQTITVDDVLAAAETLL